MSNEKTSKYISLILRHKPETIGITLDEHGWADVKELNTECRPNMAIIVVKFQDKVKMSEMEQHFDELCAKVKFYVRKIDIDKLEAE